MSSDNTKDSSWVIKFLKSNKEEFKNGSSKLTNKQLVELYKKHPLTDDEMDKYRVKIIGKWSNRWLKVRNFIKRIFNN